MPHLTEQATIYEHLKRISRTEVTEESAREYFDENRRYNMYVIGKEVGGPSLDDKYFRLYFEDVRNDLHICQRSPEVVFRKGFLKVDNAGCLSILGDNYSLANVNSNFSFVDNELKFRLDRRLLQQNSYRSHCSSVFFKAATALTVAAVGAYYLSSSETYQTP
jgi:hypothetical protein